MKAAEFLQGYLLEYALSIDNVFVFLIVFRYFKVPQDQLHRVLFWGIIGAVVSRGMFIGAGRGHHPALPLGDVHPGRLPGLHGASRSSSRRTGEVDPGRNPALRLFRRLMPTVSEYHGQKFLIRKDGRTFATPLLVVLVVVEMTDVMFAVDSIPAIFGVTTDVFIVFTSNIFAILGLRSLFFLIEGLVSKLRFLKIGRGGDPGVHRGEDPDQGLVRDAGGHVAGRPRRRPGDLHDRLAHIPGAGLNPKTWLPGSRSPRPITHTRQPRPTRGPRRAPGRRVGAATIASGGELFRLRGRCAPAGSAVASEGPLRSGGGKELSRSARRWLTRLRRCPSSRPWHPPQTAEQASTRRP